MLGVEETNKFKYALRLFPTKRAANDYNRQRLIELGKPIARISAVNNCETASKATSDEAKCLENVLCLSIDARVMLQSNIATDNGLVNGAMGIVNDIIYTMGNKPPNDMPTAVIVDFDKYHGLRFGDGMNLIPITPQTTHWKTSSSTTCQPTQLPLILCWAITIHKSQGMTLDEAFSKIEPFGNISIVLVGDMRQLPPVCDNPLYSMHGSYNQTCGGVAYGSFDKCIRLSHIFRQAGDDHSSFRSALMRLSSGTSSLEDWELFKTRDIMMLGVEETNKFKYALRLFPTKNAANDYNWQQLIELGKPIARISAVNNCETASKATTDEAKGLENVLCLSIGARVMLRSNIATDNGLVNGAMGIVNDIIYTTGNKPPNDMPTAVIVDFDKYHGPRFRDGTNLIPITPQTTHWKTSSSMTCQRTQLPLILCWAITIHKSQGMTLDEAAVDIGDTESLGLSFVALSRTRKLCDLAFCPMFSYERLQKFGNCKGLHGRLQEEERLTNLSSSIIRAMYIIQVIETRFLGLIKTGHRFT